MRRHSVLATIAWLCACSPGPSTGPDGGRPDGGQDGGAPAGAFDLLTLDPSASALAPLSLAVGPQDRVGIAYFVSLSSGQGAGALDGGSDFARDYELRYLEWSAGEASPPQLIDTVQRVHGVSLAFQGGGEPAVAYLGGGSDDSVYWLQSDAVVAYRSGAASWTRQVAATRGDQATCGNPVSDRGFLVGLNPGLVFDGDTAYLAYRDGHDGQFPQQDWAGSDLELVEGGPSSWTRRCLMEGGNNKSAYGGHISMAMAGGQPALVHDRVLGSADGTGQDVIFVRRNADGTWSGGTTVLSIANTQSGASLAWDPVVGFGIAVVDRSSDLLSYTSSSDGVTWAQPDPVFQSGSGGWYPSLAFDPVHHEPAIAYYVCSARSGANEGSCSASEDELRVAQLIGASWRHVRVDPGGGLLPRIGFLSAGKRVIAYRDPASGALRLAVER